MFFTDSQTLVDLGIFGKGGGIFGMYDRSFTRGGGAVLEEWLRYPLDNADSINRRTGIIRYFGAAGTSFPFNRELFDGAEQYLSERDERTRLTAQQQSLGQKLSGLVAADTGYKTIVKGISSLTRLLQQLNAFIQGEAALHNKDYSEERKNIEALLSEAAFVPLLSENTQGKLPQDKLVAYDNILRFRHYKESKRLLHYMYCVDAYLSVGQTAKEHGWNFAAAKYAEGNATSLQLKDVKHPAVANAKGNDITIDEEHNVVFLTGANMAGKSTFMKSVGIAVYLAHCGFAVAAKEMTFTPLEGMFSTINLPDNLGMGASHFYAEVLRVKKVAQELHAGKRLFVLFDELFRGTNVKDAGEATVAVVEGFAKKTGSLFIISTHIIEAGDILQQQTNHIQYQYLPTKMEGHNPVYTYKLEEGITADRHGMVIIRNEGIIEMLEKNAAGQLTMDNRP
ncbi:DNA mismatch repair protein [Arachidicoccus ginsenosidimutans]|uniref:MutS-related protein n=1 Tax=Arachidicoccus sp. BS20 TaxID=1850526 RepID=UPI0007F07B90|nr:DNA mismatch repair protein [Arachidicoccus sp. BS20]ANI89608.1 DNA mismatch repair protein [Arachidicoccus sp. BS20]